MIHDAIKQGDEEFLAEVLEALNKKYGHAQDSLEAYVKRDSEEHVVDESDSEGTQNEEE